MAKAPQTNPNHHSNSKSQKCRCCPYGYHIDLDFVHFAEDVNKGFATKKTPTLPRKKYNFQNGNGNGHVNGNGDRTLTSPLDDILGDSLENILSDFDECLLSDRDQAALGANGRNNRGNMKQSSSFELRDNRMQNGYLSDYTGYRTNNGVKNFNSNLAYTALGRTISEIKAQTRNTDSPFPDRDCNSRQSNRGQIVIDPASRVGTPIDLGIPLTPANGSNGSTSYLHPNGHLSMPNTPIMSRLQRDSDRPNQLQLPPMPANGNGTSPSWRKTSGNGDSNNTEQFASLRRGREYALSDGEGMQHKVRYYSASPKMPRKLQPVAPLAESEFTYTQQDGHTKLSKSQGTSMSPREEPKKIDKVTRSIAVSTGPLPPAKPCTECPNLKKELEKLTIKNKPKVGEVGTITEPVVKVKSRTIGIETTKQTLTERGSDAWKSDIKHGVNPIPVEEKKSPEMVSQEVMTTKKYYRNIESQTDRESTPIPNFAPRRPIQVPLPKVTMCHSTQTDEPEFDKTQVFGKTAEKEKEEKAPEPCQECAKKKQVFTRHVGVGCCSIEDRICIGCDEHIDEVDENDAPGLGTEKPAKCEITRAAAVKKLLTSEQKQNFVRGNHISRSARFERRKDTDNLDYVEQQSKASSAPPTTPGESDALKSKVNLKKDPPMVVSQVPEPIPAKIPRPKIAKYVPPQNEDVETPDEAEEAADKLTPLRSEMRTMSSWPRGSPRVPYSSHHEESSSDSESDISEGSYETNEDANGNGDNGAGFEISTPLREALESLNSHLLQPGSVSAETADWALKYVQHEWLKTAARKSSLSDHVDIFVEQLKELGPAILKTVTNITDQNGNTALHYAVSHGNFAVVSSLLDSNECQLNLCNKAGYTAVMLAALCGLEDEVEKTVVQRLFSMGDVNARATQHGQTALMLSVSHGKRATTELLLECGADVNIQVQKLSMKIF
ncbi:hypothetical protein WR25_08573 isoform C [Diploscapter pachys]|uniref:Uncharacterized protein n=1 Tax=Diploscapter pachys TaxID=2018661 RepID=A0A2A2JLF7_9BILA|nr:hypothetical protein WR25_08573 isoform C [Diploscapter pachys]